MNNKFIVVEGLDGSGKTTIVSKIVKYFNDHNITNIITVHEPGGTLIADTLCSLIKGKFENEPISNIAELLMLYAARSQLLENVIKPALIKGDWVIADRYDLSSFAYQGAGRGMNKLLLNVLSQQVTNNLFPKLLLYLDIDPKISFSRIQKRKKLDRIEQETLHFFNRVRTYYQKIAAFQKNIVTINSSQSLKKVSESVYKCLDTWYINFL